jgi:hypothetical protein
MVLPLSQTVPIKTARNMIRKMEKPGAITVKSGAIIHVRFVGKSMESLLIGKRRVRVVHFKQLLIKSHNLPQMHFHSLRNN